MGPRDWSDYELLTRQYVYQKIGRHADADDVSSELTRRFGDSDPHYIYAVLRVSGHMQPEERAKFLRGER